MKQVELKDGSLALYLRVPREVHSELKRQAGDRKWKLTDTAREALAIGLGFRPVRPLKPATGFVRGPVPLTALMSKEQRNGGY